MKHSTIILIGCYNLTFEVDKADEALLARVRGCFLVKKVVAD
jgi:hypothetical protein